METRRSLGFFNRELPAQSEAIDHFVVSLNICSFQVVKQTPPLRDHLQQAASRVVIFLMGFEMLGQVVNSFT